MPVMRPPPTPSAQRRLPARTAPIIAPPHTPVKRARGTALGRHTSPENRVRACPALLRARVRSGRRHILVTDHGSDPPYGQRWRPRGSRFGHLCGQAEMTQDAPDHVRVFDERYQVEAVPAPRTREDLKAKTPKHQLRPEPVREPRMGAAGREDDVASVVNWPAATG